MSIGFLRRNESQAGERISEVLNTRFLAPSNGSVPFDFVSIRRRAILVTGRRLDELLTVLPQIELFDHIVAENGAVVFKT
jgi:hypothetical protein